MVGTECVCLVLEVSAKSVTPGRVGRAVNVAIEGKTSCVDGSKYVPDPNVSN